MKSIKTLTPEQMELLRSTIKNTPNESLRKRCQCILYSYYGLPVSELITTFNVDRRSIYNWMNRWNKGGLTALEDRPGRGLKPKLNVHCQQQVEQVKQALLRYSGNHRRALQELNQHLSQPIGVDTLRRFVKKLPANRL
ncbi:helix-turn-helix domain-containing protein [Larkinella sp. VNQ87]|uniref:helix-turn-helix domain-containing protein n=1 Tax=Larkinella sp. VNQ87 TaxID=3400921 RepID=UPI003C10EDBB